MSHLTPVTLTFDSKINRVSLLPRMDVRIYRPTDRHVQSNMPSPTNSLYMSITSRRFKIYTLQFPWYLIDSNIKILIYYLCHLHVRTFWYKSCNTYLIQKREGKSSSFCYNDIPVNIPFITTGNSNWFHMTRKLGLFKYDSCMLRSFYFFYLIKNCFFPVLSLSLYPSYDLLSSEDFFWFCLCW